MKRYSVTIEFEASDENLVNHLTKSLLSEVEDSWTEGGHFAKSYPALGPFVHGPTATWKEEEGN